MVGFQVISKWICSGLGWFSGDFQVTAPKEELAQWQERPMEIVSRYYVLHLQYFAWNSTQADSI